MIKSSYYSPGAQFNSNAPYNQKKKKLQHILACCEGWKVDKTEVVEE